MKFSKGEHAAGGVELRGGYFPAGCAGQVLCAGSLLQVGSMAVAGCFMPQLLL